MVTMSDQSVPALLSPSAGYYDDTVFFGDCGITSPVSATFQKDIDSEMHRDIERTTRGIDRKLCSNKVIKSTGEKSLLLQQDIKLSLDTSKEEESLDDLVMLSPPSMKTFPCFEVFDPSEAPSPPWVHSDTGHRRFMKATDSEVKVKHVTKKINNLRKKLKHYEDKLQRHDAHYTSHSDKSSRILEKDIRKMCSELNRFYKELKDIKSGPDHSVPHSYCKSHNQRFKDLAFDKTAVSLAAKKTEQDAEKRMKIMKLETILEHEAMEFTSFTCSFSTQDDTAQETATQEVRHYKWDNIHSLSLSQLLEQRSITKDEKKRLRQKINELKHGRESQPSRQSEDLECQDELANEKMFNSYYKELKAKLKLIEALITKKQHSTKR